MAIKALVTIKDPRLSTEALSLIRSTRTQTFRGLKNPNVKSQFLRMRGMATCIQAKMLLKIIIGASKNPIAIWIPGSSILKIVKSLIHHQAKRHFHQTISFELNISQGSLRLPRRIITGDLLKKISNWITKECQWNERLLKDTQIKLNTNVITKKTPQVQNATEAPFIKKHPLRTIL